MRTRSSLLLVAFALLLAACGTPEKRAADYLVDAQKLYAAGDYVKARLEAQNAAQLEPVNVQVRFLLAQISEQQKLYPEMVGHLQVVVNEDPANVEARLKLATAFFLGQMYVESAQQTEALLRLAPKDPRAHLLNARLLFHKGDRSSGMTELQSALQLDPANVEAILLKAASFGPKEIDQALATLDVAINHLAPEKTRLLRELQLILLAEANRPGAIEVALRQLVRYFPEEQRYQFQLAEFYTSQGRVDEADQLLKSVTEADPKNADKQVGYAQFLEKHGNPAKAEAALKTFIARNPDALKLPLALAQLYESSKRLDEAHKAYADLGTRAPRSPEGIVARFRVALIDLSAGKTAVARAGLDSILKDAPEDPNSLLLRASLRNREGKFDEAIGDLRVVLSKERDNTQALLLLANTHVLKNDIVLAKDTYQQLLQVAPDSPAGLRELAALYAAGKQYPEAADLLRRRLNKAPDDLVAAGRLVEVLLAQNQTASAEAEARRMVALANQAGMGDFSLGQVLARKKDYGAAVEAFRKSMAARPGDPLALEGLASSLMAGGKRAEAKNVLVQQLDNSENQLVARFLLAGIYSGEGDQAKAAAYLEDVLKQKPESVPAWTALAGIYKEREERIRVLQRAIKAVPGTVELQTRLATEFLEAGRPEDAITVYENLLKADPKSEAAINNLAAVLLDQRTDKASHARALKLAEGLASSKNPALLDTLGWAYYRAGRYPEAVSVLERVVAKAGKVSVFRYHLGMAYLGTGNEVGAKQQLVEAVEKTKGQYPGLAEARATLEKLNKLS